jgi:hypothetical protein
LPPLLKVWLFAQSLVAAMAFVPHPRSLGDGVELFVFSVAPTLIAGMVWGNGMDEFVGLEQRLRIGAALLGAVSCAFLLAALGS